MKEQWIKSPTHEGLWWYRVTSEDTDPTPCRVVLLNGEWNFYEIGFDYFVRIEELLRQRPDTEFLQISLPETETGMNDETVTIDKTTVLAIRNAFAGIRDILDIKWPSNGCTEFDAIENAIEKLDTLINTPLQDSRK